MKLSTPLFFILLLSFCKNTESEPNIGASGNPIDRLFKGNIARQEYALKRSGFAASADINAKNPRGITRLMIASKFGFIEIIPRLLEEGADINMKGALGNTALIYACQNSHTEVVKILLENGADVNHKNDLGHTPVMLAFLAKNTEILKLLKKAGAK